MSRKTQFILNFSKIKMFTTVDFQKPLENDGNFNNKVYFKIKSTWLRDPLRNFVANK